MNNGSVLLIGGNGVERYVLKQLLLRAQRCQLAVDAHLGLTAGLNGRLKPAQKLHQRNAVAQHGAAEAFYLGTVLDGLHIWYGRRLRHLLASDCTEQRMVYLARIEQYVIFRICSQSIFHLIIICNVYALALQIVTYAVVELGAVNEQRGMA